MCITQYPFSLHHNIAIITTDHCSFMIAQYPSHNFKMVSMSCCSPPGSFSGLSQKQPLASVCKSPYKYYLYNSKDALMHY